MSMQRCTFLYVARKQTNKLTNKLSFHFATLNWENIPNSYLLTMYDLVKRSYSTCVLCSTLLGFSILMVVGCGPALAAAPFSFAAKNRNFCLHRVHLNILHIQLLQIPHSASI